MRELGKLLEAEHRDIIAAQKQEQDAEIKEATNEYLDRKNLTDEQREHLLAQQIDRIDSRFRLRRPESPSYTFETRHGETIKFESYAEIEETTLLPEDVKELSARMHHRGSQHVDISMRFGDSLLSGKLELSSANEGTLRSKLVEFEDLFKSARPGYHSLMMRGSPPTLGRGTIAVGANLCCWWLLFVLVRDLFHPKPTTLVGIILLAIIPFAITSGLWLWLFRYLYPMYEFAVGLHENPRIQIRRGVWAVIGGLFLGVGGNLIFSLLH